MVESGKPRVRKGSGPHMQVESVIRKCPVAFDVEAKQIVDKTTSAYWVNNSAAEERFNMCVRGLRDMYPDLDEATAKAKIIRRLNNRRNLGPKGTTTEMRQNSDIQAVTAFNIGVREKRPDLVISLTACAPEVVVTPPQASPGVRSAAGAPLTATMPRRSPRTHATGTIPAAPEVARTPQRGSPGVRSAAGAPPTATVLRRSPRTDATITAPAPEVARSPQRGSPGVRFTAGAPLTATVPRRSPRTDATVTVPAPKVARTPQRGSPGARSAPGVPRTATVPPRKARAQELTQYEQQRQFKIAGRCPIHVCPLPVHIHGCIPAYVPASSTERRASAGGGVAYCGVRQQAQAERSIRHGSNSIRGLDAGKASATPASSAVG